MFKKFVCLRIFIAVILCFMQTVAIKANVVKDLSQYNRAIAVEGKNARIGAIDIPVLDYSVGEKSGAVYGKVEKVSVTLFVAFWGIFGIASAFFALYKGNLLTALASLMGIIV
ncbi:hypothetical protein HWV54_02150 [Bartonella alsatica]|uniref:Uncharacterized protein n=2 Tax=Bartonella alsatica TaxID=52764 RepID=J0YN10_9HYPH|nr:hypothetical protein [Bartonella alsatica]EJF76008.1 hypothetical protein MEC_00117 [Bartonella alsatica IBS 382]QLC51751.1 hypothetical protein HWV54_02150 [Bartonella alsatica]